MQCKVTLKAISCWMQLDGLVMVEVGGKAECVICTCLNLSWSRRLLVWQEARVVAEGKNSKTGNKSTTMIFDGYAEQESDSVRMWDLTKA